MTRNDPRNQAAMAEGADSVASDGEAPASAAPEISFVVPLYNEEYCIESLVSEILAVVDSLGVTSEVIAVDDGSRDATGQILCDLARIDSRLHPYRHPKNRGQAAALLHGLRLARAPVIVTLDGDGQNDPADVPKMLAALDGQDMVVGIRAERCDSWLRRSMSRVANAFRGWLLGDHMHDSGCALKVFRREVVSAFIPVRTLYSFMPALAVNAGFRVIEMPVHHRPRTGGSSSYGLHSFLWRPLVDMVGIWWLTKRSFVLREPEPITGHTTISEG